MLLFDLDGTLVDSVPDLAAAVDSMMVKLNLPACGEARVRNWVGNGAERLVKRALTGEMETEPEQALFDRAYPLFLDAYAAATDARSKLYAGVAEGLAWATAAGYRMACVTNKPERFTLPLLAGLGIAHHFEFVVSGDTLPVKKPDPAPLLHAADFFKVPPGQALMVGDSVNDVRAARAAGFQVICVPYGYNHGRDIHEAEPDAVIESLHELQTYLEQAA
jgi:phosphoglycolate phosphatase